MRNYVLGLIIGILIGHLTSDWSPPADTSESVKQKTEAFGTLEHDIEVHSLFLDAVQYNVIFTVISSKKELSRENERALAELTSDIRFLGMRFDSSNYDIFSNTMEEYIQRKISYTDMECVRILWEIENLEK